MTSEDAWAKALFVSSSREARWYSKVTTAVSRLELTRRQQRKVDALLFERAVPGYLPLSNQHVRNASRQAFIDVVGNLAADAVPLYLITLAGVRGVTNIYRPHVDLRGFQAASYQALRHRRLGGTFSFEFDVVKRRPPQTDYPVLFHAHGIARPDDPTDFKLADMDASLAACGAFIGWDGAVGIDIRRISATALGLARLGAYLADPFHQLKRVQPDLYRHGRNCMRSTLDGFTAALALRATELQSHLSVRDTVFGVGAFGRQLRAAWWRRFNVYLPREAGQGVVVDPARVGRLWEAIRAQDGSAARFQPPRLITRSSAYRDGHYGSAE